MYCSQCGYSLINLENDRCPECGHGFDRADPQTWNRSPGKPPVPELHAIVGGFVCLVIASLLPIWLIQSDNVMRRESNFGCASLPNGIRSVVDNAPSSGATVRLSETNIFVGFLLFGIGALAGYRIGLKRLARFRNPPAPPPSS